MMQQDHDCALKLAALVYLRAKKRSNLKFLLDIDAKETLLTNVLVLRLLWPHDGRDRWMTYLVALVRAPNDDADGSSGGTNSGSDSSPKDAKEDGKNEEPLDPRKYWEVFRSILDDNDDFIHPEEKNGESQTQFERVADSRFIIYSTDDVTRNFKSVGSGNIDFPFWDLFSTGNPENIMLYDDGYNEEECGLLDAYRKYFLPRLRVFARQRGFNDLNTLITQSLISANEELLPQKTDLFSHYLNCLEKWCYDDVTCLTETSVVIEKVITNKIMKDAISHGVEFLEAEYKTLIDQLVMWDVLYIGIPDVSEQLRCCKVIRSLQKLDQHDFLVLSEKDCCDYLMSTLSLLCGTLCDALVINSDSVDESIQLLNSIDTSKLKNVIVVSGCLQDKLRQSLIGLGRNYNEWEDIWTLDELQYCLQEELMDRSVSFQGRSVTLRELETIWPYLRSNVDGALLSVLLASQIGMVGAAPPPATMNDPYVTRILCHRSILKPEVFQLNTDTDILMVTGIPKQAFKDLLNVSTQSNDQSEVNVSSGFLPKSSSCSSSKTNQSNYSFGEVESTAAVVISDGVDIGYSRRYTGDLKYVSPPQVDTKKKLYVFSYAETIALDAFNGDLEKYGDLIIEHPGKSIHWISYNKGQLIWKNSYGPDDNFIQYLDKIGEECEESPICTHNDHNNKLSTWKSKVMILMGGKGMGKTTVIKKIAAALLDEMPVFWVIGVDLGANIHLLKNIPCEKMTLSKAIDLLYVMIKADISTSQKFCRNFFKYSIEQGGNCVLLFDGLDDLYDEPKEIAIRLIQRLAETQVKQIWVGATEHEELDIKESLRSPPLELQPVALSDQAEYITQTWVQQNYENSPKYQYDPVAESLVECIPPCNGRALLGAPLCLSLFAHTYVPSQGEEKLIKYAREMANYLPRINIFRLFHDFVLRNDIREDKNTDAKNGNTTQVKKSKKRRTPLRDIQKYFNSMDKGFLERARNLGRKASGGASASVHASFSEYYIARWLKNDRDTIGLEYLQTNVVFREESFGVHSMLDWFLAEGNILHEMVLTGDMPNQGKVFKKDNLDARDLVGRQALHLAAIYNRQGMAEQLLQAGADVQTKDDVLQWTPLDYADAGCYLGVIELLLGRGAALRRFSNLRERASEEKLEMKRKKLQIIQKRETNGACCPLVFVVPESAIHPSKLGLTEELINNADNCFNEDTELHTIEMSRSPIFPLPQIAFNGYKRLAEYLLGNNLVDDPCLYSVSSLHIAAYYGHKDILQLLLKYGMKCDIRKHDGRTPLHVACQRSQLGAVKVLLKGGADVNAPDNCWMTPMMLAARCGAKRVVQELVKHGTQVDARDQGGRTPLYHATEENHMEAVKVLLDAGANVYFADKHELSPMVVAIAKGYSEIVLEMYRLVGFVKARDLYGATPLHHLCAFQNMDLFLKLLVRRHEVNVADYDGVTPLHIAAKRGNVQFVEILLKRGADPHAEDRNRLNALHYATMGGNAEIVERMLNLGVKDTLSEQKYDKCLHLAATIGNVEAFQTLLNNGAEIDTANRFHCYMLHHANISKNVEMIKLLLDIGIDPNSEDIDKNVPLHIAVRSGVPGIVEMLLQRGANPNMATKINNHSPLHVAATHGHVSIVEKLLQYGASPNIVDRTNSTPVLQAVRYKNPECLEALVKAGGKTERLEGDKWFALHVAVKEDDMMSAEYLLSTGMDVDLRDSCGYTPLLLACKHDSRLEFIKFLVNRGADLTAIDSTFKRTALHHAVYRDKIEAVELLLDLGLDIHVRDKNGSTPLHTAVWMGHKKCVRFLVSKGANVNDCNVFGEAPLHIAFETRRRKIALTLMQLGANPIFLRFRQLDVSNGFVNIPHFVRNSIESIAQSKQFFRNSPSRRDITSKAPRKKSRVRSVSKVHRKRDFSDEAIPKTLCPTEMQAEDPRFRLIPSVDIETYFPPKKELRGLILEQIIQVETKQKASFNILCQIKTKNLHPEGSSQNVKQDSLQNKVGKEADSNFRTMSQKGLQNIRSTILHPEENSKSASRISYILRKEGSTDVPEESSSDGKKGKPRRKSQRHRRR